MSSPARPNWRVSCLLACLVACQEIPQARDLDPRNLRVDDPVLDQGTADQGVGQAGIADAGIADAVTGLPPLSDPPEAAADPEPKAAAPADWPPPRDDSPPPEPSGGGRDAGDLQGPPIEGGCGMTQLEADVVVLVNRDRASEGLGHLVCDELAVIAAKRHSEDMCAKGFFSHDNLEGQRPEQRLFALGARFMSSGENISKGESTAAAVHADWMRSEGHKGNILGNFRRIGIGYARCRGQRFWTEVLMY